MAASTNCRLRVRARDHRDHHDRQRGMSLPEPGRELQTVPTRHLIVQNDGGHRFFRGLKRVACVAAIPRSYDFVAIEAKQGSVELPHPRVIVQAHHGQSLHSGWTALSDLAQRGLV
jgi:hypothetical protein